MAPQGFDGFTPAEVAPVRVVWRRLSAALAQAAFVAHARDKAEVVYAWAR